ncbi:MAG TPA: LysR family transcriptional regulator [Steroidobacteraceae bacterium]|nr:LysR family transcriptional regulator [Steroidobacteraceae bacterium]
MNWERVRVFLAVARSGQMLAAARNLGLNHATVGRQLAALEEELQCKLIERHVNGCTLTSAGESMLATAERVESEFLQFESGLSGAIRGTVRIGAPDGLGNYFIAPRLAQLSAKNAHLLVQLLPMTRTFSLSRREVDIVIGLDRPMQGNLIIQKLTDYTLSFYASEDFIANNGPFERIQDLLPHPFITYVDDLLSPGMNYGRVIAADMPRRFECGGILGQIEAVRAGCGVAILNDYAAIEQPKLQRILPNYQFVRSYWLISHPDTHGSHRVTAVRRHIADSFIHSREKFCPWGVSNSAVTAPIDFRKNLAGRFSIPDSLSAAMASSLS